jgi:heme-degrading monooxygenase HmoA
MIARSWDGVTPAAQADEYADYVRRTGVTDLAATDGNRGVYLLRRREGDRARFRVLSLWDSMEGVRRFAGDDAERARYYPETRASS